MTVTKTYLINMLFPYKAFVFHCTCHSTKTLPHSYTASFSMKTCFYETKYNFYRRKTIYCFWKYIKNKDNVRLDTFLNFSYASIYLQSKTFALKWDCKNFLKLHMQWRWPGPFLKSPSKFYKYHNIYPINIHPNNIYLKTACFIGCSIFSFF